MVYFEACSTKELLYSLIFACSEKSIKSTIINLSPIKLDKEFLGVKIININAKSKFEKYSYYFSFVRKIKDASKVYVFHDVSALVTWNISKETYLIENGLINYIKLSTIYEYMPLKARIFTMIFTRSVCGRTPKITKIYLTAPEGAPEDIAHKVTSLDLLDKWNKVPKNEKEEINNLFDYELSIEGKYILILTQPLEDIKEIDEKTKIQIYKKLIDSLNLSDDTRVLIKPHPREKTNYNLTLDNNFIIAGTYPVELIYLNNKEKIEKLVTLFSSAAVQFIGVCPIVWRGLDFGVFANINNELPEKLRKLLIQK